MNRRQVLGSLRRRDFLIGIGSFGTVVLAGCIGDDNGEDEDQAPDTDDGSDESPRADFMWTNGVTELSVTMVNVTAGNEFVANVTSDGTIEILGYLDSDTPTTVDTFVPSRDVTDWTWENGRNSWTPADVGVSRTLSE